MKSTANLQVSRVSWSALLWGVLTTVSLLATAPASAAVGAGQQAPDFSLKDLNGRAVQLADFKGRTVVLEWHNPGCPFVQKFYDSGKLPAIQRQYAGDVVWLAVNSTHPGHQDHRDPAGYAKYLKDKGAEKLTYLLDPDGKVGRAYGARTTPHLYVIDGGGRVAYAGAIDSVRSANPADIAKSVNHVTAALDEIKSGRPVSVASTTPYGCSVKYR